MKQRFVEFFSVRADASEFAQRLRAQLTDLRYEVWLDTQHVRRELAGKNVIVRSVKPT